MVRGGAVHPLMGGLLVLGFSWFTACGGDSSDGASGGSSATGGVSATGGNGSTGGSSQNGGSATSGGNSATGGAPAQGGSAPNEAFPTGFGVAEPLVTQLTRPVRIGFKNGFLYFTEMGLESGSNSRLARRDASGNVQTLFSGNTVAALFLDDDELFFVERGTRSVFRMKYQTLTPELFATTPDTVTVGDVGRLGENIWFSEFGTDGKSTAVVTKPRAGGAFQDVLPVGTHGFVFSYMTIAAGQVYLSTLGTNVGLFKGTATTAPVLSVSGVLPRRVAADANFVYFGSESDGRILRQAHNATMSAELVAEGQNHPFGLAVDSGGVYWTNGPDCDPDSTAPMGSVAARALAGGAPVVVAANERCPQAIVTDSDFVYWIRENPADNLGDDSIMRAKKLR
ncbi:MAG TPA: hypothetical protein VG937_32455 [Polyangiaceae bacterium]|nr:hypothetical protein [Polyangiaceae bacterium]